MITVTPQLRKLLSAPFRYRTASAFLCILASVLVVSTGLAAQATASSATQDEPPAAKMEPNLRLGQALRDLGRDEEAIEAFRQALAAAPDNVVAHQNLGSLLGEIGEVEEALEHLQRAVALDAGNGEAHHELAEVLRRADRWDEALSEYQIVIDLEPGDENATIGEAEALVATGRFSKARAKLEEALVASPDSRGLKFGLTWLLASCPEGQLRDGERALEMAQELFTTRRSLAAAELIASARAEAGDCEGAAEMQRFVVGQALAFDRPPEALARFERDLRWFEASPCRRPEGLAPSERSEWPRNRNE